jgi:hypothetical protein
MEPNLQELKQKIDLFKSSRHNVRQGYPPEIRDEVRKQIARGQSINKLSQHLQVSADSIHNWCQKRKYTKKSFKELNIKQSPLPNSQVLITVEKKDITFKLSLQVDQYLFLKGLIDVI